MVSQIDSNVTTLMQGGPPGIFEENVSFYLSLVTQWIILMPVYVSSGRFLGVILYQVTGGFTVEQPILSAYPNRQSCHQSNSPNSSEESEWGCCQKETFLHNHRRRRLRDRRGYASDDCWHSQCKPSTSPYIFRTGCIRGGIAITHSCKNNLTRLKQWRGELEIVRRVG